MLKGGLWGVGAALVGALKTAGAADPEMWVVSGKVCKVCADVCETATNGHTCTLPAAGSLHAWRPRSTGAAA